MDRLERWHQLGDYTIHEQIGEGGFAKVFKATALKNKNHPSNVAIKVAKPVPNTEQYIRLREEIVVLKKCRHINIVQFYDCFEVKDEICSTCIVMELCDLTMYQYLEQKKVKEQKCLDESETTYYVEQLLKALSYLHDRLCVIHRDLKLSNLLLKSIPHSSEFILKLCDFGMVASIDHPDNEQFTHCGTTSYIAPEVHQKKNQTYARDLWSVGVIFYYLITGSEPFKKETNEESVAATVSCDYNRNDKRISYNGYDFLEKLLQVVRNDIYHTIFLLNLYFVGA